MGNIDSIKAYIRVLGYVISDSGKYLGFGYPDIRIPIENTIKNTSKNKGNLLGTITPLRVLEIHKVLGK